MMVAAAWGIVAWALMELCEYVDERSWAALQEDEERQVRELVESVGCRIEEEAP